MSETPLNGLELQKAMELFEQTTATLKLSYDNLQEELGMECIPMTWPIG